MFTSGVLNQTGIDLFERWDSARGTLAEEPENPVVIPAWRPQSLADFQLLPDGWNGIWFEDGKVIRMEQSPDSLQQCHCGETRAKITTKPRPEFYKSLPEERTFCRQTISAAGPSAVISGENLRNAIDQHHETLAVAKFVPRPILNIDQTEGTLVRDPDGSGLCDGLDTSIDRREQGLILKYQPCRTVCGEAEYPIQTVKECVNMFGPKCLRCSEMCPTWKCQHGIEQMERFARFKKKIRVSRCGLGSHSNSIQYSLETPDFVWSGYECGCFVAIDKSLPLCYWWPYRLQRLFVLRTTGHGDGSHLLAIRDMEIAEPETPRKRKKRHRGLASEPDVTSMRIADG